MVNLQQGALTESAVTDLVVCDSCEVSSKHLTATLEVLDRLGTDSLAVLVALEDLHKGLERGGLEDSHRVEWRDIETGIDESLGNNLIGVSLLILEDVLLDDVKRVEKLRVFVEPEVIEIFLGDTLLALEENLGRGKLVNETAER